MAASMTVKSATRVAQGHKTFGDVWWPTLDVDVACSLFIREHVGTPDSKVKGILVPFSFGISSSCLFGQTMKQAS